MRVLCCVNRDLASNITLNRLLPVLAPHEVLIALSERVGAPAADEPRPRRDLRIAEQELPNERWFPLLERAQAADAGGRWLTFAEIERLRGHRVVPLSRPNSPEGLGVIERFAPDVILTVRYGAILKEAALSVPALGTINLHSGLLPAYRGVLATFRALLAGDREIGCTLHYIEDGTIDTGGILASRTIPVDPTRSLLWHILSLYEPGAALIAEALASLARGERPACVPQPAGGAYYTYPTAADWNEFLRRGWRVADPGDLSDVFARYMP